MHELKIRRQQSGVALALALIVLVVLTLLGVAAMRSSKLALRLSGNSQSRMSALQQAQSFTDAILGTPTNLPVLPGTGYFLCTLGSPVPANASAPFFGTPTAGMLNSSPVCANYVYPVSGGTSYTFNGPLTLPVLAAATAEGGSNPLNFNTYGQAVRVPASNGQDFVPTNSLRSQESSGRDYDFASFLVIGGFDNGAGTSAGNAQGVAEVNEGIYKRHNKIVGQAYQ